MSDNEQVKIFAQNLSYYVNASGKLQKDIAKELEIPQQTFNGWCNGVSFPSMGKVQKLADYFHIGKTDLLDNKSYQAFSFSDEEKDIIMMYRALNDDRKKDVSNFIKMFYQETIKNEKSEELA